MRKVLNALPQEVYEWGQLYVSVMKPYLRNFVLLDELSLILNNVTDSP